MLEQVEILALDTSIMCKCTESWYRLFSLWFWEIEQSIPRFCRFAYISGINSQHFHLFKYSNIFFSSKTFIFIKFNFLFFVCCNVFVCWFFFIFFLYECFFLFFFCLNVFLVVFSICFFYSFFQKTMESVKYIINSHLEDKDYDSLISFLKEEAKKKGSPLKVTT